MRLRNITGSENVIAASSYVVHEPEKAKGNWNNYFPKKQPIHIEIGMGKGRFIIDMAKAHPDVNYIGIERYTSVLLRALQKLDTMEEVPTNLLFLCMDAKDLEAVFAPGEVNRIYLNFSDPWPKDRHAKRRLPSREFLARYERILEKNATVEFKTDNRGLFDFAVLETEPAGWTICQITYDLHQDPKMNEGNIMTEYEEKFSSIGNPIFKYIIKKEEQ